MRHNNDSDNDSKQKNQRTPQTLEKDNSLMRVGRATQIVDFRNNPEHNSLAQSLQYNLLRASQHNMALVIVAHSNNSSTLCRQLLNEVNQK